MKIVDRLEKLENFSDAPLTPAERRAARRLIQRDERVQWLFSVMSRVAIWVTVVVTGVVVGKGWLVGLLKDAVR